MRQSPSNTPPPRDLRAHDVRQFVKTPPWLTLLRQAEGLDWAAGLNAPALQAAELGIDAAEYPSGEACLANEEAAQHFQPAWLTMLCRLAAEAKADAARPAEAAEAAGEAMPAWLAKLQEEAGTVP
eukprot:EG_transcript_36835